MRSLGKSRELKIQPVFTRKICLLENSILGAPKFAEQLNEAMSTSEYYDTSL
jgi:hypothetical protein